MDAADAWLREHDLNYTRRSKAWAGLPAAAHTYEPPIDDKCDHCGTWTLEAYERYGFEDGDLCTCDLDYNDVLMWDLGVLPRNHPFAQAA
jgi:hypothetical protein